MPPTATPRIAFLLAHFYSGATLVNLLLDGHPEIASSGELFESPRPMGETLDCSCGALLDRCPVQGPATAHIRAGSSFDPRFSRWLPAFSSVSFLQRVMATDRAPGRWKSLVPALVPGAQSRVDAFVEAHERIAATVLQLRGSSLFLDGCKSLRRAELFLSLSRHESSPLILVVRHPVSWVGSNVAKGKGSSVAQLAGAWKRYVLTAERLAAAYDAPLLHIRYEAVCQDPRRELSRAAEHLGLAYHEAMYERWTSQGHHVTGHAMRRTFDGTVHPATDRSHHLTAAGREVVRDGCAELMERLGFD